MYKDQRIAVVVPAYNEGRHIGEVLREMPEYVDTIVAVDDCSSDNTLSTINESPDPRVVAMQTERNQGVGGATMTGMREAIALGADARARLRHRC